MAIDGAAFPGRSNSRVTAMIDGAALVLGDGDGGAPVNRLRPRRLMLSYHATMEQAAITGAVFKGGHRPARVSVMGVPQLSSAKWFERKPATKNLRTFNLPVR